MKLLQWCRLGLALCFFFFVQASGDEYLWQKQDTTWVLTQNGQEIGRWLPKSHPTLATENRIEKLHPGVFRITRVVWNNQKTILKSLRLTLDFVHADTAAFLMIPSVSYNGNHWGRGKEPKGFQHEGTWWSFSSRRTPIPGATYSEGTRWAVALWGEITPEIPVLSCSLIPENGQITHRLIWPEEEMPLVYSGRDRYLPGTRENLNLAPEQTLTCSAILVIDEVKSGHRAMATFLSQAWEKLGKKKEVSRSPEDIWNVAVQYAKESLWAEEGIFRGFSIGLRWQDGRWIQRPSWKYEIGWCGQNASLANSLLTDHLRTNDSDSLKKALTCLDTWATHCPLPNGLFRTHFDYVLGLTQNREVLDACNLGTAALNYFEAFELAKKCGVQRPQYRKLALDLCEFMVRDQEANGRYGKGWTTDGACLYRDGTIGAFLIPPMLEAYHVTSEDRFLQSARRAFDFYFGELETLGYSSAGALDTWCIDKESSMPLLRSALKLHEITGDKRFLEAAELVSWYLSTWLWHYSVRYPEDSDFSRYGFDTFGGTSVSTQHHHLDPYALFWVKDWLDLAEKTKHPIWREKALAIWFNGNQLISDGTLEIRGKTRPAGAQNEGYLHAHWGGEPGTINDWLVAWPGALRLETLRRLQDWNKLR